MVTIARTICPHVVRVVDRATFRICWAVESTYTTPDQSERVDYVVSHGGVTQLSGSATTYERRQPEFSDKPSRMPGVVSGQAPVRCYSLNLPLATLPRGELTVTATARGHDGTTAALEQVIVWNDETGVHDSRPSTAVVHWRPVTGNNSNGGTSSSDAVRDLPRAIALASVGGVCGGATIIQHENCTGNGNPGNTSWGTWRTDAHWLTIEAATPGLTWRAHNPPSTLTSTTAGGDYVSGNTPAAGQQINVRFRDLVSLGGGISIYDSSGHQQSDIAIWWEGGEWGSQFWDDNGPRVRCLEDIGSSAGGPIGISGIDGSADSTGRKGRYYLTGMLSRGTGIGLTAADLAYDCEIRDHIGGSVYAAGWPFAKAVFHSIVADRHNYKRNLTRGWGCNREGEITDLQPLESQDRGGGIMRILGPVGGYRFDLAFADNVDSLRTRLGIRAWPGVGTDQTGRIIRGTGLSGGRPYVDIEHTGTYGPAPAGAEIETVVQWNPSDSGGGWEWFNVRIHPSSLSRQPNRGVVIFRDIAPRRSTQEVQSHFSNLNGPIDDLLIDNCRDAGTGANWTMAFINSPSAGYRNSIFRRITASTSGMLPTAGPSYPGFQVTNCVFRNAAASLAGLISGGAEVDHNHFVEDNAGQPWHGTNATYGVFLATDPTVSPWVMRPLASFMGNGDPRQYDPPEIRWSPTGSTPGCLPDVGELDWSDRTSNTAVVLSGGVGGPVDSALPSGWVRPGVLLQMGLVVDDATNPVVVSAGPGGKKFPVFAGSLSALTVVLSGTPFGTGDVTLPVGSMTAHGLLTSTVAAATVTLPQGVVTAHGLLSAALGAADVTLPQGGMTAEGSGLTASDLVATDVVLPSGTIAGGAGIVSSPGAVSGVSHAGVLTAGGLLRDLTPSVANATLPVGSLSAATVDEPEVPEPPRARPAARRSWWEAPVPDYLRELVRRWTGRR